MLEKHYITLKWQSKATAGSVLELQCEQEVIENALWVAWSCSDVNETTGEQSSRNEHLVWLQNENNIHDLQTLFSPPPCVTASSAAPLPPY